MAVAPAAERLLSRIEVNERGCWVWQGALNKKGYGVFGVDGKVELTHRWTFRQRYGWVPKLLDHYECDTKACCNPEHLMPSTSTINIRRAMKDVCAHGHRWDESNTYIKRNGRRDCRACNRDRARRRFERTGSWR